MSIAAVLLGAIPLAFGQSQVTSVSAANYRPIVAPGSVVAAWGAGLANTTVTANNQSSPISLPDSLGGVNLDVTAAANNGISPGLYFVSPGQVDYVLPEDTPLGSATLTVDAPGGQQQGDLLVSRVSPGIFTADSSGAGVAAAQILRVTGGQGNYESPAQAGSSTYMPRTISLYSGSDVYIILYGTGLRGHSLNPVIATVGGTKVPVLYAGAQSQFPGLDQVNLGPIPLSLAGAGTVDVVVTVDGVPSNPVQLAF